MCPCHQNDPDFACALLAATAILVGVSLMRKHWSRMNLGVRLGGVSALILLVALLGYAMLPNGGASTAATGIGLGGTHDGIDAGGLPCLVELGAGLCEGCKKMAPIIEEMKREYTGRLHVESINVQKEADRARSYQWTIIPCQVFLDPQGKELWRHEGVISKSDILAKWAELGFGLGDSQGAASKASSRSDPPPASQATAVAQTTDRPDDSPTRNGDQVPPGTKVIAYYFHRTMRCHSCLTIEELSKQVIEGSFQAELAEGMLEYRTVNIDEPGNQHFEKDYGLTAQSLVLVRMKNGQQEEWKNLERVWELLEDCGAFREYVEPEVSRFVYPDASILDGSNAPY